MGERLKLKLKLPFVLQVRLYERITPFCSFTLGGDHVSERTVSLRTVEKFSGVPLGATNSIVKWLTLI